MLKTILLVKENIIERITFLQISGAWREPRYWYECTENRIKIILRVLLEEITQIMNFLLLFLKYNYLIII